MGLVIVWIESQWSCPLKVSLGRVGYRLKNVLRQKEEVAYRSPIE